MLYAISFLLLLGGLTLINLIFSYQSKHIDPQFGSTLKYQLLMLAPMLAANLSIGYGVKFGYKASQQLAFVLIAAKCLEIGISLAMGYFFQKEIPTLRTWIGLSVIAVGLLLIKTP